MVGCAGIIQKRVQEEVAHRVFPACSLLVPIFDEQASSKYEKKRFAGIHSYNVER